MIVIIICSMIVLVYKQFMHTIVMKQQSGLLIMNYLIEDLQDKLQSLLNNNYIKD